MWPVTLYYPLVIYIMFLVIFFSFLFFNVHHIVMSASYTFTSFFISFFVIVTSLLILYLTWQLLSDTVWSDLLFEIDTSHVSSVFGGTSQF